MADANQAGRGDAEPSYPPSGCRFHTRCPRFPGDVCRYEAPPWRRNVEGPQYRCHIPPEELRR